MTRQPELEKILQASASRPFPHGWQPLRFQTVGLRDHEAAGLGGVKNASVRDHRAQAFP